MITVVEVFHMTMCDQCGKKKKAGLVTIDNRHCPLAPQSTHDRETGDLCDAYRVNTSRWYGNERVNDWHYDCQRCVKEHTETKYLCRACLRVHRVADAF